MLHPTAPRKPSNLAHERLGPHPHYLHLPPHPRSPSLCAARRCSAGRQPHLARLQLDPPGAVVHGPLQVRPYPLPPPSPSPVMRRPGQADEFAARHHLPPNPPVLPPLLCSSRPSLLLRPCVQSEQAPRPGGLSGPWGWTVPAARSFLPFSSGRRRPSPSVSVAAPSRLVLAMAVGRTPSPAPPCSVGRARGCSPQWQPAGREPYSLSPF